MKSSQRRNYVLDYLQSHSSATIQELAEYCSVSHMTIRRDLDLIAEQEPIKIIHGGVLYQGSSHTNHYLIHRARLQMADEKLRIARRAASLVEPDDIIIIDAGSTGELIAKNLPTGPHLTVICYALNIAAIVSTRPNCCLILTGGMYHEGSMVFEDPDGLDIIRRNRARKAFITASGISMKLGITCSNFFETATKRTVLESSLTRILVADSSKFGEIQTGHFSDLEDFDIIITDTGLPVEFQNEIQRMGKTLYLE